MRRGLRLLPVLLLLPGIAAASPALFEDSTALEITLTGPLSTVINGKKDRDEGMFTLAVNGVQQDVVVRARGNSRRQVCPFPPLRLDFMRADVEGSPFSRERRLKLVVPCRGSSAAQNDTLDEYTAYRIFNVLSEDGYRVRLMHIRFEDTASRKPESFTRTAFVIESDRALATRIGAKRARLPAVTLGGLNVRQAARMFVYQYLIGNTDWSLVAAEDDDRCCHNLDLFERDGEIYTVAYDYDQAGLVNASYAKPDRSVGIRRVSQRRYRGYCIDPDAVAGAVDEIAAAKDDIMAVSASVPGLDEKAREWHEKFLGRFFDEADDRERLLREFEKRCL